MQPGDMVIRKRERGKINPHTGTLVLPWVHADGSYTGQWTVFWAERKGKRKKTVTHERRLMKVGRGL